MIAGAWPRGGLTVLAAALAASGLGAAAGPAAADCPVGAPTGFFKGTTLGGPHEVVDVALNLACADGRYVAQFFTSQSDFEAAEATGAPGQVSLKFDARGRFGHAELKLAGDKLAGDFQNGMTHGGLKAERVGPAKPLDALTPTIELTPAQWREDLDAFAAEMPKRHANAFFHTPKSAFDAEIARLKGRLDRMNNDEVFVGLERIANAIGDGHTGVNFPADRQLLPIQLQRYGKDVRVVAAGPGLEAALGAKVVRIGGLPIGEAWTRALTLTPQDELPELQEGRAVTYLRSGLLLHGLGIAPDRTHAAFTVVTDEGRKLTLDVARPPADKAAPLQPATAGGSGLAKQNPGKPFWCQELAERRTVYCAFHGYDTLIRDGREMAALLDKAHPAKLVIDMRDNGGGDNTIGYAALVKPLTARADLNQKGRLYVLVGALTFSAAMNNAAQFQDETQAILVGEQIGEKPNSYQEPRQFRLPNSHLIVRASSLYYKFREHGPNAVAPDKTIVPTWDDVKAGRDPALDWVLAQPAP
ncbi:hypothetical protein [Phenylobacterium sp.]|uniref:hypothetical protein n=1 Tax=Phenylobacterium sp. TaxID=1871053 RepID=UPI002BAD38E1|nr:hypothetical protein [Phenylobacterium sp.]HLZ74482.1 hypothetical protein [Phenylobacterium sp.]